MSSFSALTLPQLLVRLTLVPVFAAGLIGLVRFRRLSPPLRWLAWLMAFVLPLNVLGIWLMLRQANNLFLMPVYAVGEFGLLALVYGRSLRSAAFSRALPWLVGGFAAYVLADSLLAQAGLTYFRPGQQVLQSGLVLGFVGLYFRKMLRELRVERLRREPMFWVSAGLFIYYAGYLQIALFSNYLLQYSRGLNMSVWAVHSLLFIVLYCCYCVALCLTPQK